MSSNTQQPYWYSIQYDGESTKFGYIDQQGTTVATLGGNLVFEDGKWQEASLPYFTRTEITVTDFGETGCQIAIFSFMGLQESDQANLVFKTKVDFTKPLPLDQLSLADSSYAVILGPPPTETTTYAVREVTPTTGPTT